jgi:hypothetical protein
MALRIWMMDPAMPPPCRGKGICCKDAKVNRGPIVGIVIYPTKER